MIFNLASNIIKEREEFIRRYVEAMGSTHWHNRDPMTWWTLDELTDNPPKEWLKAVKKDRSLLDVLSDAKVEREEWLNRCSREYGLSTDEAKKVLKTYLGYNPAYGAYLCQIGPYMSHRPVAGSSPYAFSPFVWRKQQCDPATLAEILADNITKYQERFGIKFDAEDLGMVFKANKTGSYDPAYARQPKKIVGELSSLDQNDPNTQAFAQRAPYMGKGSLVVLNPKGYEKLLRNKMGKYYQETIAEIASKEGISQEEVINNFLNVDGYLDQVYQLVHKKYKEAVNSGEAAALGMSPPPSFRDKSLSAMAGSLGYSALPKNNVKMIRHINLLVEVLDHMAKGETNPEQISAVMNKSPERIDQNNRRIKRKLEPIWVTPEVITYLMGIIERDKQNSGIADNEQLKQNKTQQIQQMQEVLGYKDLKTAFEMAALYFSTQPKDPATRTLMGHEIIIFNPDDDFENYNGEDLRNCHIQVETINQQRAEQLATETPEQKKIREDIERQTGLARLPERQKMALPETGIGVVEENRLPEEEQRAIETKPQEVEETEDMEKVEEAEKPEEQPVSKIEETIPPQPVKTKKSKMPKIPSEISGISTEHIAETETKKETPKPIEKSVVKKTEPKPVSKKPKMPQIPPEPVTAEEPFVPSFIKKKRKGSEEEDGLDTVLSETFINLIKIAEELDNDGDDMSAEEIHNIIRKHKEGLL